jgi:hypothetical protein
MKQTELDRELRLIAKTVVKENGWKWVGGMAYWTIGPLFFCAESHRLGQERALSLRAPV